MAFCPRTQARPSPGRRSATRVVYNLGLEGGRPLGRRPTPMGEALVFGLIGSSALIIGGAIGAFWRAPHPISGVLVGLASRPPISAPAVELVPAAGPLG